PAGFPSFGPREQVQVAQVDQQAARLARDEDRVAAMDGVDQQDGAAKQAEPPERARDDAAAGPLGGNPLQEEAGGKRELSQETHHQPGTGAHAASSCAMPHAIAPAATTSTRQRRWRRDNHHTPARSSRPTARRCRLPYFDLPALRGRWFTGTVATSQPSRRNSAGRNRCMWPQRGSARNASRSNS